MATESSLKPNILVERKSSSHFNVENKLKSVRFSNEVVIQFYVKSDPAFYHRYINTCDRHPQESLLACNLCCRELPAP